MTIPLVSIITPTLNCGRYLEDAIKSVLAQDYPAIEYIIVDGGSSDKTIEIIKKFGDRISKWISEPDKGTSDAVNKGIKMCSGEIIGFLMADDYYEPGIVTEVVAAFDKHKDADVIYGDLRYLNPEKNETNLIKQSPNPKPVTPARMLFRGMPITLTAALFRKQIFNRYGLFDLSFKIANDADLYLRFLKNGVHFIYMEKLIVNMRAGGMSDALTKKTLQEVRKILLKSGFNRLVVNLSYVIILMVRIMEKRMGSVFRKLGLYSIIKIYRKIFYEGIS